METLETPALIADHDEALPELRELMEALTIPGSTSPLSHSLMTVVVRPGLCVFGPNEGRWCYTNHLRDCYSGELILVTEHGWSDLVTGCAGHFPALAA